MPANNPLAYLIDPRLRQQQAQGLGALNELRAIPQGSEYAMALRDATAQMPAPTGQGWSHQSPTFMNVLSNMVARGQGREKLRALDTRAQALREQAQQGQQAELDIEEQRRQQDMQFQQNMLEKQAAGIQGPYRTYVNNAGEKIVAARTGQGLVDSQGQPFDATGFQLYEPRPNGSGRAPYASEIKRAAPKVAILKNLQEVRSLADELDRNDLEQINALGKQLAAQTLTPKSIWPYLESNWMNFSPKVKRYLNSMRAAMADVRHSLSGVAVTQMEKALTDAFLASAEGLTLDDRMRRIGSLYNRTLNSLEAVDEVAKTDYSKPYKRWEKWFFKPDLAKPLDTGGGRGAEVNPRLQQLYDAYFERTGEYHRDDPRKKSATQTGESDFNQQLAQMIEGQEF